MKTPAYWYPDPQNKRSLWMARLLSPASLLFRWGTRLRLLGIRAYASRIPLLCIGNVVAGGAGKTPTSLAIARLLIDQGHHPAFVTRGYGGRLSGVIRVDPSRHTVQEVGDEALLLAALAPTWIGRDRAAVVREAEKHADILIMDDGLQNPSLRPSASLLVLDGETGIGNGRMIPAGPLREPLSQAMARAKAAVIIGQKDRQNLAPLLGIPVFRAQLVPVLPSNFPHGGSFIAFAGLARPQKLYTTARDLGLDLIETVDFPDHHVFSEKDLKKMQHMALVHNALLLTTEKDAVRLPDSFRKNVFVLPVRLVFDDPAAPTQLLSLLGLSL